MEDSHSTRINSQLDSRAVYRLSNQVISIEFTLISVMVGVLLFMLIENATPLLRDLQFEYWLYILADLAFVMLFWTNVMGHSLGFVVWPLDVGHALLFILLTVVTGLNIRLMNHPIGWWITATLMAFAGMSIVVYDLELIRRLERTATGQALELYRAVHERQTFLFRAQIFNLISAPLLTLLISFFPQLFVEQHWHLAIVLGLALWFIFLMWHGIRDAHSIRDLVFRKTIQDLQAEE